jgi:hypothetical protein
MKNCSLEVELFHVKEQPDGQADRQTDMTKLIVSFRNFANVPNNYLQPETVGGSGHNLRS